RLRGTEPFTNVIPISSASAQRIAALFRAFLPYRVGHFRHRAGEPSRLNDDVVSVDTPICLRHALRADRVRFPVRAVRMRRALLAKPIGSLARICSSVCVPRGGRLGVTGIFHGAHHGIESGGACVSERECHFLHARFWRGGFHRQHLLELRSTEPAEASSNSNAPSPDFHAARIHSSGKSRSCGFTRVSATDYRAPRTRSAAAKRRSSRLTCISAAECHNFFVNQPDQA